MRTYLLLIACAVVVGATIATVGRPARQSSPTTKPQKLDKAEFKSQFPITDINAPAPADQHRHARWKAKSKKYKGIGMHINEEGDAIGIRDEWDIGLPVLPVSESAMVVVGEVVDAQSYLSEGRDWVYGG
jgi:hypothetical protein